MFDFVLVVMFVVSVLWVLGAVTVVSAIGRGGADRWGILRILALLVLIAPLSLVLRAIGAWLR